MFLRRCGNSPQPLISHTLFSLYISKVLFIIHSYKTIVIIFSIFDDETVDPTYPHNIEIILGYNKRLNVINL